MLFIKLNEFYIQTVTPVRSQSKYENVVKQTGLQDSYIANCVFSDGVTFSLASLKPAFEITFRYRSFTKSDRPFAVNIEFVIELELQGELKNIFLF